MPRALITGVTGQDGSYLAELLLHEGYEVHGLIRRSSSFNTGRVSHIFTDPHTPGAKFFLHYGDLSDSGVLGHLIYNIKPDEIYHLAAQSHVRVSFDMPEYTGDITALGTTRLLEAIRRSEIKTRFYQASSSEMFGASPPPQSETTPLRPRSPYAAAKVYSYWMVTNYRVGYGLHASNGILFNHESPRRGETFVTRKVARAVAAIRAKKEKFVYMGNLKARRDWGYAPEYVEGMKRILRRKEPGDYVLGTGASHTVQEFVEAAFSYAGLRWKEHVKIDPRYFRPTETEDLRADARKAEEELEWKPRVRFEELVRILVDHEMAAAGLDPPGEGIAFLKGNGFSWLRRP